MIPPCKINEHVTAAKNISVDALLIYHNRYHIKVQVKIS